MNIQGDKIVAIINGFLVDPANSKSGKFNIFIEDGRISEVSDRVPADDIEVIDAEGFCVAPGFIDLHVHLREPGYEYKEDIESGSRAAVAGGFTTICCMPNTKPVNDGAYITSFIKKRAGEVGLVRIHPVGAISKESRGEQLADIEGMAREGVIALSDDGGCIQDTSLMREAMTIAKGKDLLVIDHPEDFSITDEGIINEGEVSKRLGLPGIVRDAENRMIERDIELVRETGCRLHIAHLSTAEGIDLVRKAKTEGLPVTCEVTPHHLLLTDADVERLGPNAKMKPPLRTEADRRALIEGLGDGTVDAIATDHAPHAREEKRDIESAAFGIIGMEMAFPVCMKLVEEGSITIERLIELFTIGPARVVGIDAGGLSEGSPADVVIFDRDTSFTIRSTEFKSKSTNTPFDGWEVKGKIRYTLVSGMLKYKK